MSGKKRSWTDEQKELFEQLVPGELKLPRVAVRADAGSGKTSVLVERVLSLPPEVRVLCVSFTERSKADLEERLAARLSAEVYTIHGFCGRVVAEFGSGLGLSPLFRIMDEDESLDLFRETFNRVYRVRPPASVQHGMDTFLKLCEKARECGQPIPGLSALEVTDCAAPDQAGGDTAEFVGRVLEEYEAAKRKARGLEYADLERYAALLLSNRQVAATLASRYGHVFVDEFQDTSPVQCLLVRALTGGKAPLFIVGDEKQSIYRFRGADVSVFRQYVETLPAQRKLSANFRSHREVIEAVNAVSAEAIPGYEPMVAGRIETNAPAPPLGRAARILCETDADGIAAVVSRVIGPGTGLTWADVVLLLRRVKGNQKLFRELSRRGIGVAVTSSGNASSDEILLKLLNLWIWACEPWQKLRAAQVLADFGQGGGAPHADPRARLRELLEAGPEPVTASKAGSCEQLLSELDHRFGLSARFGATFAQFSLFILRHQEQGVRPSQLARRLHQLLEAELDVPGFMLLAPPSNLAGSIRALTVHSSKGLEFPVVILADLSPRKPPSGAILKHGHKLWLAARDEDGDIDKTHPGFAEAKEHENLAEQDESARLLYVAMTRAREALYVLDRPEPPVTEEKPAKRRAKAKAPAATWKTWLGAGITNTVTVTDAGAKAPASGELVPSQSCSRSRPLQTTKPEYRRARLGVTELAALQAAAGKPVAAEPVAPPKPSSSQLRPGDDPRTWGVELHGYLEREDWEGLRRWEVRRKIPLRPFWNWLETPEGKLVFPAGATGGGRIEREFGFEWRTTQGVVTGRIDRLVVTNDQEAWIVDYKLLFHRRTSEDLQATYSPQLRLYAEAVKKLTQNRPVQAFILDVAAATGRVWHLVDLASY